MVFDGFNWYPKGSMEAVMTMDKITARQPMYGPNGSRTGVLGPPVVGGVTTPTNPQIPIISPAPATGTKPLGKPAGPGQRMASSAIADLVARRGWNQMGLS